MKSKAGRLWVAYASMTMLLECLAARNYLKCNAAEGNCKLSNLINLTKHEVEQSLTCFDKANGDHLDRLPDGFPQLEVNTSLSVPKVQCSLTFMSQGLEEILKDQRDNLNPNNISLQNILETSIDRIKKLKNCVGNILKVSCPNKPKMPEGGYQRKRWSHTLLVSARDYLARLLEKCRISRAAEINNKRLRVENAALHKYIGGSLSHL